MGKSSILKELFYFKGRFNRTKYIFYPTLVLFIYFVLIFLSFIAYESWYISNLGLASLLIIGFLITLYINIIASLKRLRDIDKPLWWIVFLFMPAISIIANLYLIIKKGTNEINRYGEESIENNKYKKSMIITSCILIVVMVGVGAFTYIEDEKEIESIEIVKSYMHSENETVEEYIEGKIDDLNPSFIDDWYSEKVEENIYMVSFDFDKDNDAENGYSCYPYEVNLDTNEVVEISSKEMIRKYKKFGYFYDSACTNEFEYEMNNK